ncbi:MAG TPA: hypothetical protein VMU13_00420 [Candidatus Paceibacterota bacterium]|nr:hypothetical protein [Candidatus Paceibacterota bacterium]
MANDRTGVVLIGIQRIIMNLNSQLFSSLRAVYQNRNEPEYARRFAELYWQTLLLTAVLIIGAASVYGLMLFFTARSQPSSTALPATASSVLPSKKSPPPAASNLNRPLLDATISGFAQRQTEFQALEESPTTSLPDPSQ